MNTKIFKILLSFVGTLFLFSSCLQDDPRVDWDQISPLIELPYVSHTLSATKVVPGEDISFDLMVNYTIADKKDNKNDIPVGLAVDEALVAKYNTENQASYILLPAACYTLPEVLIAKGTQLFESKLAIQTASLQPGKQYLLPVVIQTVPAGYTISGNFGVLYLRVNMK